MGTNTINRKIEDFNKAHMEHHKCSAVRRFEKVFAEAMEADDDYAEARNLIEKLHLVIGNRRTRCLAVGVDLRAQNDD